MPKGIQDSTARDSHAAKDALDMSEPPGLRKRLEGVEAKIAALQTQLDAPNQKRKACQNALSEWQMRRKAVEGDATDAESLKGLEHMLESLTELPAKIADMRTGQEAIALQIYGEKAAQVEVYRALYDLVQGFIDSHALLKERLKLEFHAEFGERRLLRTVAKNSGAKSEGKLHGGG